jgi:hypothetical protein
MAVADRKLIISELEKARHGSRVLCCLTSDRQGADGMIAKDFIPIFFEHLQTFAPCKRIDVFMFTAGGDTLAAFGLSRLVRRFTPQPDGHFGVLVPEKCHSGGTLFLLGADEVVMTSAATLTPIDPSVQSPLGPTIEVQPGQRIPWRVGVESVAAYLESAKEQWRLNEAGLASAFMLLSEKIHPIVLGDIYRSRRQIQRLAASLLSGHASKPEIDDIVPKLTGDLGSHDYLIFRDEAASFMGSQIAPEDPNVERLIWRLYEDYRSEMELGKLYAPAIQVASIKASGTLPAKISQKLVLIESTARSDFWRRDLLLSERIVPSPMGPVPMPHQEVTYNGWN